MSRKEPEKSRYDVLNQEILRILSEAVPSANISTFALHSRLERVIHFLDGMNLEVLRSFLINEDESGEYLVTQVDRLLEIKKEIHGAWTARSDISTESLKNLKEVVADIELKLSYSPKFYEKESQHWMDTFITGILQSNDVLFPLAENSVLIRLISGKISTRTRNNILARIASLPAQSWLYSLNEGEVAEIQELIKGKIVEHIRFQKTLSPETEEGYKIWHRFALTFANFILDTFAKGKFQINVSDESEALSQTDDEVLNSKEVLRALEKNNWMQAGGVPEEWITLSKSIDHVSGSGLKGNFLVHIDANGTTPIDEVNNHENRLKEKSVVRYLETLRTIAELETFLMEHKDIEVRWDANGRKLDYSYDTVLGKKVETVSPNQVVLEDIHYLVRGKREKIHFAQNTPDTKMGVLTLMRVLNEKFDSLSQFENTVEVEVTHALHVLDSLQIEDEFVQSAWEDWYSIFRSKLESLLYVIDEEQDDDEDRAERLSGVYSEKRKYGQGLIDDEIPDDFHESNI